MQILDLGRVKLKNKNRLVLLSLDPKIGVFRRFLNLPSSIQQSNRSYHLCCLQSMYSKEQPPSKGAKMRTIIIFWLENKEKNIWTKRLLFLIVCWNSLCSLDMWKIFRNVRNMEKVIFNWDFYISQCLRNPWYLRNLSS